MSDTEDAAPPAPAPVPGVPAGGYPAAVPPPAEYNEFFPEFASLSLADGPSKADAPKPKLLPGGKVKQEAVKEVLIKQMPGTRNKRKMMTVVSGLEHFDVKLDKAAKAFAKRFSCGASVSKGTPGAKGDEIEIQGDFYDDLKDVIMDT